MVDTYKLQYNGMSLAYPGWGGFISYKNTQPKTLTLHHSEGGTLTASDLTGYPGDTVNLSTAYNTYWRFSGYRLTGDGGVCRFNVGKFKLSSDPSFLYFTGQKQFSLTGTSITTAQSTNSITEIVGVGRKN